MKKLVSVLVAVALALVVRMVAGVGVEIGLMAMVFGVIACSTVLVWGFEKKGQVN